MNRLPDFELVEDLALHYNHMGATITSAERHPCVSIVTLGGALQAP